MSCKCQNPKKMKNSAGGVDFYVCARSQGGCGEEIGEAKTVYGAKAFFTMNGKVVGEITNISYQVNPHKPKIIECPQCYGGGMVAKLYPNGHTEVSCEYCDGVGEVEL